MHTFNDTNITKQGHDFANRTADKAKDGIEKAASALSDTVDSARQRSEPVIDDVGAKANKMRDSAVETSDSLITYTKNNPVKALLVAAAAGAVFLAVMNTLTPSRD